MLFFHRHKNDPNVKKNNFVLWHLGKCIKARIFLIAYNED